MSLPHFSGSHTMVYRRINLKACQDVNDPAPPTEILILNKVTWVQESALWKDVPPLCFWRTLRSSALCLWICCSLCLWPLPFFQFLNLYIYIFIWLHWVLASANGIFKSMRTLCWGMWDLVPWSGIEPGPPALGAWSLRHRTTREVPWWLLSFFPLQLLHILQESTSINVTSFVKLFLTLCKLELVHQDVTAIFTPSLISIVISVKSYLLPRL